MSIFKKAQGQLFRLGEEIHCTRKILTSSKKWLTISSVPSVDVDVVITFPSKTDQETIDWIVKLLQERVPEVILAQRYHRKSNEMALYCTASYRDLLRGAEALTFRKRLLLEFGGGFRDFSLDELDLFENVTEERLFITNQERQTIVLYWLNSLTAQANDKIYDFTFCDGQKIFPILEVKKIVSQIFPLHNPLTLARLNTDWVQTIVNVQPMDEIQEYFGVRIALYFAWLGHYTLALIVPTFLGFLLNSFIGTKVENIAYVLFVVVNMLWITLYFKHWRRTSCVLTYRWGTLNYTNCQLLEEPRPLFRGELRKSRITGRLEPFYPEWKRRCIIYFISLPITAFCLSIVVLVAIVMAQLQIFFDASTSSMAGWIPKIGLAVIITILDDCYKRVAYWLNDLENHRLEDSYRNHLISKLILFQFMNSYFSLFYVAFYLRDMRMLHHQLAAMLITRQVFGNIKEVATPYVKTKIRHLLIGYKYEHLKKQKSSATTSTNEFTTTNDDDSPADPNHLSCPTTYNNPRRDSIISAESSADSLTISQAEEEAMLPKYDDPYEDFLEMFIQFGYVSMFTGAFPLAGLCCLINNIMEIRSDAFKLTSSFQRPFGKNDSDIGVWQSALMLLSCVAVIVNVALLGVSKKFSALFPDLDLSTIVLLLVIFEHLILLLKFTISNAVPDVPHWVEEDFAKIEYRRREALKLLEKERFKERRRDLSVSRDESTPSREASIGRT